MHTHHNLLRSSLLLMMLTMLPAPASVGAAASSDALALLAFKSTADPDRRLRYTSTSVGYHCWWRGVQCSPGGGGGRVTRLVLEGVGLRGTIEDHTLTLLDQLRVLSLKNNSLTGPVPDLSSLHNLKALFLSHNSFVGSLPPSILSLRHIRTLDLSHNNLSGDIPPAAGSAMQHLHCLLLQNNRLRGSLPAFNQSTIKIFNVSGNALSGPVPVTLFLLGIDSSAFSGNLDLCGRVVHKECAHYGYFFKLPPPSASVSSSSSVASASPAEAMAGDGGQLQNSMLPTQSSSSSTSSSSSGGHKRKHKKRTSMVAGFLVFTALAFGIFGLLLTTMRKKRHKPIGKILSPEKTAAAADATESRWEDDDDDFDACNQNLMTKEEREREREGERERGISDGELAAAASISEQKVKKLGKSGCLVFCAGEASMYSLEQLMKASAEMLGRGRIGSTYKAVLDNRLIISVKRLDHGKLGTTTKETFDRHMDTIGKLRHPNVVPLRAYFQAKEERLLVYDYQSNGSLYSLIHGSRSTRAKPLHWTSCLKIAEDVAQGLAYIHQASRLVHGNLRSSNVLLGADFEACITDNCLAVLAEPSEAEEEEMGHRAPEARTSNRHLTPKSDIYSFGVLLLELLTGRPSLQSSFLVATDLPVWVRSVREENGGGGGGGREDDRLMMLVDIAEACVKAWPENRPTTWQVLKMIQELKAADVEEADVVESL